MPEIWLNYGPTDVVLDIKAENLEQQIDSEGQVLEQQEIIEILDVLDLSKPIDLVVLHDSVAVRTIITCLHMLCEQKSMSVFPVLLADRATIKSIKPGLPEGVTIHEFGNNHPISSIPLPISIIQNGSSDTDVHVNTDHTNQNLVFLAETEFDGLFGYQTVATRLLRMFDPDSMLSAYAKRDGNLPSPGKYTASLTEAKKFVDKFEIKSIELVATSKGITGITIGHPSQTTIPTAKKLESGSIREIGEHKSMIVSTGKTASNYTLSSSLASLWNCSSPIKKNGVCILVAECTYGLGGEAIQRHIENRLSIEQIVNPSVYLNGMEDLLFLSSMRDRFQIGLVSILPDLYTKKLGMIQLQGVTQSLAYILKTQGSRQKVSIVSDGARILLR